MTKNEKKLLHLSKKCSIFVAHIKTKMLRTFINEKDYHHITLSPFFFNKRIC